MLDITKTPVARTVTLDLMSEDRWSRNERVVEEPAPTARFTVASFVTQLFPEQVIEHLGRKELVNVAESEYDTAPSPSSLFFQAVHKAYKSHHALGLRPEVLMYLINSVVAETVRRHPEEYRDLFTSSEKVTDIHITHNDIRFGDPNSPWDEALAMFEDALKPYMPSRIMSQMLPDFTTATSESNVASLVSFMDAASPYYDYHGYTLCGIPRIVLFGEASDYRKVVNAATELSGNFRKHLSSYFEHLIPVLATIAKAAEGGRINEDFWSRIYKYEDGSGTPSFNGWITAFLWYLTQVGDKKQQNSLVEKESYQFDWKKMERSGISSGSEPAHVCRVPLTWHYFGKEVNLHMIGGVLGVDIADAAITPNLSYGVLRA